MVDGELATRVKRINKKSSPFIISSIDVKRYISSGPESESEPEP